MGFRRILVVGAQSDVKGVLVEILSGEGYAVSTFDSADDAIEIAKESALPIVLLFAGLASFAAARARCEAELPRVTVILATGHNELPPFPGVRVLKKPFTIDKLLAVLERES